MKTLSIILSFFLILGLSSEGISQKRVKTKTVKRKNRTVKKTVVKNKNGKTVAHKTVVKNRNGKTVTNRTVIKRKPHTRYSHLPKRGVVIKKRPTGARVIKYNKRKYWLHNGVYYRKYNGNYKVVRPRRGLRIRTLPIGYRRIVVKNKPYFYYYGTYYSQVEGSEEYEVVDAPMEAQVDALPEGYETIIADDGSTEYKLDGVTYKEVPLDEDGKEWGYQVVKVEEVTEEE